MTDKNVLRRQAYKSLFKGKAYYLTLLLVIIFTVFYVTHTLKTAEEHQVLEAYSVIGTVTPLLEEELFSESDSKIITSDMLDAVNEYLFIVDSKNEKIEFAFLSIKEANNKYLNFLTKENKEIIKEEPEESLVKSISLYNEELDLYVTKPFSKDGVNYKAAYIPLYNKGEKTNGFFGATYTYYNWVSHGLYHTIIAIIACIVLITAHFFLLLNYYYRNLLSVSEEKRRKSEKIFKDTFEQIPMGISLGKGDGYLYNDENVPYINPAYERITGRNSEELSHIIWSDITHPDDVNKDLTLLEKFRAGSIPGYSIEKRYIDKKGVPKWAEMRLSNLNLDDDGFYHICMIQDIDEKKRTENALNELMRSRSLLLDNLPGAAYRCRYDEHWTMEFISEGIFNISGFRPHSFIDNIELSYNDIIAPEYRDYVMREITDSVNAGERYQLTYEIVDKVGYRKWVWEQGSAVTGDKGEILALEGIVMDITESVNKELELAYLNMHDILTGLYNKETFVREFSQDMILNDKWNGALLLLEVSDNLVKTIFTYGKDHVENALVKIGKSMINVLNKGESLYTIEKGLYLVYIKGNHNKKRLTDLANQMIEIAKHSMAPHNITPVCGILEGNKIPEEKLKGDEVLKLVQLPLRFSNRKDSEVIFYSNFMMFHQARKDKILEDMRIAFSSDIDSLKVVFQPIIDVKKNKTVSFEALSRIVSESLGIISPSEFIPIAEETGDIIQLGKIVLIKSINFIKELEEKGFTDISISVNVSPLELIQHDYVNNLKEILEGNNFNPEKISLEITETAIPGGDLESFNKMLEGIKQLGVKISIDDFGTGYSSLSRTRELPVDFLKIDRYFINKLDLLKEENAITQDIISLAHRMGHKVVAEGVETESQLEYLKNHDCDYIQGYFIGKPMSKQDAFEYLKEKRKNEKI